MPIDLVGMPTDPRHAIPPRAHYHRPTTQRRSAHSDGLNEADEMNLYAPNPLLDSPFGPSDLEWLYRQQDVDGGVADQPAGAARAGQLHQHDRRPAAAPALSRSTAGRRTTSPGPTTTPAAPSPTTARSHRISADRHSTLNVPALTNASIASLVQPERNARLRRRPPSLAHRDKKINLNYPLPVSNDPNEPVRQKWISDTYQLAQGDPAAHGRSTRPRSWRSSASS